MRDCLPVDVLVGVVGVLVLVSVCVWLDTLHHHTQWKAFFPLLSMFYLGLGGVVGVWEDLPTIDIVQRSAFCYPNYGAHLFTRPDHRRLLPVQKPQHPIWAGFKISTRHIHLQSLTPTS